MTDRIMRYVRNYIVVNNNSSTNNRLNIMNDGEGQLNRINLRKPKEKGVTIVTLKIVKDKEFPTFSSVALEVPQFLTKIIYSFH